MSRYFTYKIALWIFFISLISYLIVIRGVFVKTDALTSLAQGGRYLVYIFLESILLFPLYLYVKINNESTKHFFRYRKVEKLHLGYLLLISISMFLMLLSADYLCYMTGLKEVNFSNDMVLTYNWNMILLVILGGIITPFVEEAVFRGFLFRIMFKRKYSPLYVILISSLIFAVAHMNSSSIIEIFLSGLILGYVAYFFHSIIPSIIIHSIYNMLAIFETNLPQIRESVIYGSKTLVILALVSGILLLLVGILGARKHVHIHHKHKEKGE